MYLERERIRGQFGVAKKVEDVLHLLPLIDADDPEDMTLRAAEWLYRFGHVWFSCPIASFDAYDFADALSATRREALARAIRQRDDFAPPEGWFGRRRFDEAIQLLDEPIRSARRRESKLRKQLPLFQGL